MPAPVGNKYAANARFSGHPRVWASPDDLWQDACDYYQWAKDNPLYEEKLFCSNGEILRTRVAKPRILTIEGFLIYLGRSADLFWEYRKYEEYADVISRIERLIYAENIEKAAAGFYNSTIVTRKLGLVEKQELSGDLTVTRTKKRFDGE